MTIRFAKLLRFCFLVFLLTLALRPTAQADSVPVRQVGGSIHGLIEVRSEDGRVVASGDITRAVSGDRVTAQVIFRFKDGSIDEETTVYSQHRTLLLITDHHVQKGRSFPHPIDLRIDMRSGQVTVHSTGKDGKDESESEHLDLPPDLANGMMPVLAENLRPDAPTTTVSMVVLTPKPRLVKLVISHVGDDKCFVAGAARKAIHYEIKVDLGGVAQVVAPLIGKKPPNFELWTIGGAVTAFIREQGPLYAEGPMMTIQPASPTWPSRPMASH